MTGRSPTVGVLHVGEMGAALAAVLRAGGARVVTTLAGRGDPTARRCREAGVVVLETMDEVVRQSDVVICTVPPAAAAEVATAYAELAHLAPPAAVYVDANSIGPDLAQALAAEVTAGGRSFVDAAVNGLAKNLTTSGTVYLSGPRADEVARLLGGAARVRVLGDQPGRASAMKMLLSGLSKGLCALYAETALVARRHGMLAEMTEAYAEIYPGVTAVIDRMLPTYAQHAGRRAAETRQLEETARAAGQEPCVLAAVRELHERLSDVAFGSPGGGPGWTAAAVVDRLAAEGFLSAGARAADVSVAGAPGRSAV